MRFLLILLPLFFRFATQTKRQNQKNQDKPSKKIRTDDGVTNLASSPPVKENNITPSKNDNNPFSELFLTAPSTNERKAKDLWRPLDFTVDSKVTPDGSDEATKYLHEINTPTQSALSIENHNSINEIAQSSSEKSENTKHKRFIVSFKQIKELEMKFEYNLLYMKNIRTAYINTMISPRIYSHDIHDVLYFHFIVDVCSYYSSQTSSDELKKEIRPLLEAMIHQISCNEKSHYLLYFSFSTDFIAEHSLKFNMSFYFLISMFSHVINNRNIINNSFKNIMQNLVVKCPFDEDLHKDIQEMPVKIKEIFNFELEIPNKVFDSNILLPVIGLIYGERTTQTNDVLKEFSCRIWEGIKRKSGQTRNNLSMFYQLEFLEEIQRVLKNLEKKQPHEEILIKEVFHGIIDLVTELKFVGLEFPCRLLRRGNVEIFENFVGVLKKIDFSNCSDLLKNLILDCIREFERFFHQQFTIFLNDFVMEFEKQSEEANLIKSIQDSWKVIGKFTLFSEIHEIKRKIPGSETIEATFKDFEKFKTWNLCFGDMTIYPNYCFFSWQINDFLGFFATNVAIGDVNFSDSDVYPYSGFKMIQTLDKIDEVIHNEKITDREYTQKFNEEEIEQINSALELYQISPKKSIEIKKPYMKGFIRYLEYSNFKKIKQDKRKKSFISRYFKS